MMDDVRLSLAEHVQRRVVPQRDGSRAAFCSLIPEETRAGCGYDERQFHLEVHFSLFTDKTNRGYLQHGPVDSQASPDPKTSGDCRLGD